MSFIVGPFIFHRGVGRHVPFSRGPFIHHRGEVDTFLSLLVGPFIFHRGVGIHIPFIRSWSIYSYFSWVGRHIPPFIRVPFIFVVLRGSWFYPFRFCSRPDLLFSPCPCRCSSLPFLLWGLRGA